ncbi:hypothetical protein GGR34_001507 [Microvirga flocculans]|uniref:Uncharacterized protein n=1 Tax=Microvirga flocculans TaxID=217168 RepID=A0A7W6IE90_9HYPH|nr:hypothetical protein [Microvirga flocculans]MBB4039860.1 hypothetical protein [Microvirga flocculans]
METLNDPVQHPSSLGRAPEHPKPLSYMTFSSMLFGLVGGLVALSIFGACSPAAGQGTEKKSWPEIKCERYKTAWTDALAHRGVKGLSAEFMERHEAFLASGCTTRADVCPQSEDELYLADMMVAAVVNAGIAGTFLPFMCRK